MNKTLKMWMMAVILICSTSMVGCGNKNAKQPETKVQTETKAQTVAEVKKESTCLTAVDDYLVNEIGQNYSQGDVCIPCAFVVNADESNMDDILVWGDFWVFNFDIAGDTLKCVSGGDHPGLMHVKKTENGFEVTSFDAVADGADNMPSAKRIFGDKYDAFWEFNSNQEKREEGRLRTIAEYVKKHKLPVKLLQDYGWPAVELP
ncbi:MAG: hypothetical protein IKI09_07890 [Bacteroidales bacterium]|nr:hypothetical protein [Bacteroidales bacterium]